MSAAVVAIGSELLLPGRRDTNAEWLIARLADCGVTVAWRAAVGDDLDPLARAIGAAWDGADVVVLTGGLGPTEDDRTREALARALGAPLTRDPAMAARIEAMFTARGRTPSARQALQADRPEGSFWIDNPLGSAPGILLARDGKLLAALPGVPAEMKAMFDAAIAPRLAARPAGLARTTLKVAGRPESYVDDLLRDLYSTAGTDTTILAAAGSVELVVTGHGPTREEAEARVSGLTRRMRDRLGNDLYGADHDTLASVVGRALAARGATVATAESCTGGMLGAALTDVPGASAWFRGGLVCYANDLKVALAGVAPVVLAAHGAVSAEAARALAEGARRICGAEYGVGVTGIAGPDGGTAEKPVGTVHIAIAGGASPRSVALDWPGDRELIRRRAVTVALDQLRRTLLG
jgi:nicotinamide-nucleotide amidase